jgi:hypothetical protein
MACLLPRLKISAPGQSEPRGRLPALTCRGTVQLHDKCLLATCSSGRRSYIAVCSPRMELHGVRSFDDQTAITRSVHLVLGSTCSRDSAPARSISAALFFCSATVYCNAGYACSRSRSTAFAPRIVQSEPFQPPAGMKCEVKTRRIALGSGAFCRNRSARLAQRGGLFLPARSETVIIVTIAR